MSLKTRLPALEAALLRVLSDSLDDDDLLLGFRLVKLNSL
jgi:hypothetical protein